MKEAVGALLVLPDDTIVLQRRTDDAPTGAGKLSFFGGGMERGETPLEGLRRELAEETDLPTEGLHLSLVAVVDVSPRGAENYSGLRSHVFRIEIPSLEFQVFEGLRAEAYSLDALRQRLDLSGVAQEILHNIFGGTYGTEHNRS